MTTLRTKLLNKKTIKVEKLFIEEWEEDIYVKGLNSKEVVKFATATKDNLSTEEEFQQSLKVVILCVVDEDGKRVFSEADIEALGEQAFSIIQKITTKAMELSGLGKEAEKN